MFCLNIEHLIAESIAANKQLQHLDYRPSGGHSETVRINRVHVTGVKFPCVYTCHNIKTYLNIICNSTKQLCLPFCMARHVVPSGGKNNALDPLDPKPISPKPIAHLLPSGCQCSCFLTSLVTPGGTLNLHSLSRCLELTHTGRCTYYT